MVHTSSTRPPNARPQPTSTAIGPDRASRTPPIDAPSRRRRDFLRGIGVVGVALTSGTGIVASKSPTEPTITFPDGTALVLERAVGPMRAAVKTESVYMPAGGWVVISTDPEASDIIGRSIERLPAGRFERLMVAVRPQEPGTHQLYATLFSGDKRAAFPGEGPAGYGFTQDDAEIRFG